MAKMKILFKFIASLLLFSTAFTMIQGVWWQELLVAGLFIAGILILGENEDKTNKDKYNKKEKC